MRVWHKFLLRYLTAAIVAGICLTSGRAGAQSVADSTGRRHLGPRRLPYREGDPIPPGYVLQYRSRTRPIVGGAIVLGSAYLVSLVLAVELPYSDPSAAWLTVPVLGPWFAFGARPSCHSAGDGCDSDLTERAYLVLDGLAQATGTALLLYGVLSKSPELLRFDLQGAQVEVTPAPVGLGYGMALRAAF